MVLAVVDLHGLGVDMRLKRVVRIRERGEFVRHLEFSSMGLN
jgi:hypothetical protein